MCRPTLRRKIRVHDPSPNFSAQRSLSRNLAAVACCASLVAATLIVLAGSSARAQSDLKRDFPKLLARAGAERQPADFVIAVDRSGSMGEYWPTVQSGVASFLEAVPDGDYISVVAFGSSAGQLRMPRQMTHQTRAELIDEIKRIEKPTDTATDIGAGLEKSLDELNRPNGNRLKFVFLFTDFAHSPPASSKYPSRSPQDAPWQSLAARKRNEQSGSILQVFALLLPVGGASGRDLALGRAVFPEMQELVVNRDALQGWFVRRKAEIERDRLRALIEHDVRRGPFTLRAIEQKGDRLVATFDAVTDRIVETSSLADVHVEDFNAGALQSRLETLPADTLKVTFTPGAPLELPLARIKDQSKILKWGDDGEVSFRLSAVQGLEPADELTRLNPQTGSSTPSRIEFQAPVERRAVSLAGGYLPLWVLFALLGLVATGVFFFFHRRRPHYLSGEIGVTSAGNFPLKGKTRVFEVGRTEQRLGCPIDGAEWKLIFQAFHPPEKARGAYVTVENGSAMMQKGREKIPLHSRKWERLPPDPVLITIEETTVRARLRQS
jgi:Mg-chelatase subunit ChlD